MKLLLDFLPIILFFGTFRYADAHKEWAAAFATDHLGFLVSGGVVGMNEAPVLLATVVVMVATLSQVVVMLVARMKIHMMLWVSLALVLVFGGATIWFHNETFIKWKPSALYWLMGLALWISQAVFRKNLLQAVIGNELTLPVRVWRQLNVAWIAFFAFMGLLNLYVAFNFSTSTWADFKVFGATGLMLVFTVAQGLYLSRHIEPDSAEGKGAGRPGQTMTLHRDDIAAAITAALAPTTLDVHDDSHLHAGHAGAREGRHFSVRVVSARFAGVSRIGRHRLIYDALGPLLPQGVHALAIDARAPGDP